MHAWLVSVADSLQNVPLIVWLGSAQYAYPFIQLTHFTGLSMWLGTTMALDFRLLGAGKKFQTATECGCDSFGSRLEEQGRSCCRCRR